MNNDNRRNKDAINLLRSLLPDAIIRRLQKGQKLIADAHDNVVILFSGMHLLRVA
jgi:hypothetical protein